MKVAGKLDLLLERWLRERNSGNIVWITKDKRVIPIQNITDIHLENTINRLIRKEEEYNNYLEALGSIGDLEF